jgi:hypothetical protein
MGGGEESEKRKEAWWRNGFQTTRVKSDGWALKFIYTCWRESVVKVGGKVRLLASVESQGP